MKDEALRQALEAAYLLGFNASGEGYNGEYPFGDRATNPEKDAVWVKDRDNALQKALANDALDRKAENARELGLDYEPAPGDIRALKHRIHELEGEVLGYKQMLDLAEKKLESAPVQNRSVLTLDRPMTFGGCPFCGSQSCVAGQCRSATPPAAPVQKREHVTDGGQCWCSPDTDYIDPETGAAVIIHKEPQ